MRLRVLAFLLVLTAGDYLLWDWSIAANHDIVSLLAGLTLVPLAAVCLAQLALAAGRLMSLLFGRSTSPTAAGKASWEANPSEPPDHATSKSASSSGKLAA